MAQNKFISCEDARTYYDLSLDKIVFMKDRDKIKILKEIIGDIRNTIGKNSDEEYLIEYIQKEVLEYLIFGGK